MATRVYESGSAAPITTIAGRSDWTDKTALVRGLLVTPKDNQLQVAAIRSSVPSATSGKYLLWQLVSRPLPAGVSFSGMTVKGGQGLKTSGTTAIYYGGLLVRLMSQDGTVERGLLLGYTRDDVALSGSNATNSRLLPNAGTALAALTSQAGDRIVVEFGIEVIDSTITPGQNITGYTRTDQATDISADATQFANTWIEFSGDFTFNAETPPNTPPTVTIVEKSSIGPTITLPVGAQLQLNASITDPDTADGNLAASWGSATPAAATVDASGLVTAVAEGESVVTATAGPDSGGATGSDSVTIVVDNTPAANGNGFSAARHIIQAMGGVL